MLASFLLCQAGKRPVQCGFKCNECFSQDIYYDHVCDACGKTLLDEELRPDGEHEFCADCAGKIIKEAYYKEGL